jgi:tetratricopeptide (TPR) repeat protein
MRTPRREDAYNPFRLGGWRGWNWNTNYNSPLNRGYTYYYLGGIPMYYGSPVVVYPDFRYRNETRGMTVIPRVDPVRPSSFASFHEYLVIEGDKLLAAGKYAEAAEKYRTATSQQPENAGTKAALANALFALGNYEFAAEVLRKSLLCLTDDEPLPNPVGKFPTNETFVALLRKLESRAALRPGDGSLRLLLGFYYLCSGRTDSAISELRDVVSRDKEDLEAAYLLRVAQRHG